MTRTEPLRIGVAGVHGHGRGHVDAVLEQERAGTAVLAAVADPRGGGDVPAATLQYRDATAMIDAADLDIVVLSTPIPTHVDLTLQALARGVHVLLEKPPVVSVADHERVLAAAEASGRSVQVGFQSLASDGVAAAAELAHSGELGDLLHFGAVGLWSRSDEYWRRSSWSGRRHADGRVVADGVVTNPLAHAVATALAIAGAETPDDVRGVDLDLYRAADIDTDDTSSLTVDLGSGRRLAAALVTSAPHRHEPYVLVRGSRGFAVYLYTRDDLIVVRDGAALPRSYTFGRRGLVADLVSHVRDATPLAVPLARTGAFTRVLEAVTASAAPAMIASELYDVRRTPDATFRVVRGVEEWSERAAWEGRTFREIGAPWATR